MLTKHTLTMRTLSFIAARHAAESDAFKALEALYEIRKQVGGWQPFPVVRNSAAMALGRMPSALEVLEYEVMRDSALDVLRAIFRNPRGSNRLDITSEQMLCTQFEHVALPKAVERAHANLRKFGFNC
jgi:hypothetical protein